jgi:hypothetical protein
MSLSLLPMTGSWGISSLFGRGEYAVDIVPGENCTNSDSVLGTDGRSWPEDGAPSPRGAGGAGGAVRSACGGESRRLRPSSSSPRPMASRRDPEGPSPTSSVAAVPGRFEGSSVQSTSRVARRSSLALSFSARFSSLRVNFTASRCCLFSFRRASRSMTALSSVESKSSASESIRLVLRPGSLLETARLFPDEGVRTGPLHAADVNVDGTKALETLMPGRGAMMSMTVMRYDLPSAPAAVEGGPESGGGSEIFDIGLWKLRDMLSRIRFVSLCNGPSSGLGLRMPTSGALMTRNSSSVSGSPGRLLLILFEFWVCWLPDRKSLLLFLELDIGTGGFAELREARRKSYGMSALSWVAGRRCGLVCSSLLIGNAVMSSTLVCDRLRALKSTPIGVNG